MPTEEDKKDKSLDELLIKFVREQKPETVGLLVEMIQRQHLFSREEIMEHVLLLQKEGKLSLKETEKAFPSSFLSFILSDRSAWFWVVAVLSFSTIVVVAAIPENAFPFVYARYILGLVYVLFLPGYCFIRAFFMQREFEYLEQIVFSLGLSIVFVFLIGLLLNYSPWGITLAPIILSLLILTLVFSIIALFREYQIRSERVVRKEPEHTKTHKQHM